MLLCFLLVVVDCLRATRCVSGVPAADVISNILRFYGNDKQSLIKYTTVIRIVVTV